MPDASEIDLDGLPQPDNREVTARLVERLYNEMAARNWSDAEATLDQIEEVAGAHYTAQISARAYVAALVRP